MELNSSHIELQALLLLPISLDCAANIVAAYAYITRDILRDENFTADNKYRQSTKSIWWKRKANMNALYVVLTGSNFRELTRGAIRRAEKATFACVLLALATTPVI